MNVTPPLCVPQHSSNPVSSGGNFDILGSLLEPKIFPGFANLQIVLIRQFFQHPASLGTQFSCAGLPTGLWDESPTMPNIMQVWKQQNLT